MLNRVTGFDRGTLNAEKSAILDTPAREADWALDQVGNWTGYDVAKNGGASAPANPAARARPKENSIVSPDYPEKALPTN